MRTTLIFIRHAETQWNRHHRVQGHLDSPLTEVGKSQAKNLQNFIHAKKISAAYTSDSDRCIKTAELALQGSGLPLHISEDLRERNLGIWEGRVWQEVVQEDPAGTTAYKNNPDFKPEGGETWNELQARVWKTVNQITNDNVGKTVAIFTSGGALRSAFMAALQSPGETWSLWRTWNAGISILEKGDNGWRLVTFNNITSIRGNNPVLTPIW